MAPPRRQMLDMDGMDEVAAALGGGSDEDDGSGDDEVISALNGAQAPQQGKVITLPTQRIEGDPNASPWYEQLQDSIWPYSEQEAAQQRQRGEMAQAAQHYEDLATPTGMASKGASYLASPLLSVAGGSTVAGNAAASGVKAGLDEYAADPNHDPLDALVSAGSSAVAGGGITALGKGLGAIGNRARMAAFNANDDDLVELGMNPQEFNDMTSRLGANNTVLPMSRTGKMERVQQSLASSGQAQAAAIREADRLGVGANRDWGGEIARDIDTNADLVRTGGSPQREAIINQMAKASNAAEAHPMQSLEELRRYKTARAGEAYTNSFGGLDESAAGKATLAAADSAGQHLDRSMQMAGPAIDARYSQANNDFADGKVLEEMLLRKQQRASPLPDAAAATVGALATGGNPLGAGAGVLARRVAAPYAADATANLAVGLAGGASAAGAASPFAAGAIGQWLGQKGVRMEQTPQTPEQVSQNTRGNLGGRAAEQLLQSEPQALGKWTPDFQRAQQEGSIDALITRLVQDSPEFRNGPYVRIQAMTAPGGGGMR